ncbi:MAG TPA: sigma-70 family RNA polymerase sigma factor [Phycisphaerae bacterium]|nr:sigma-70 family RNA polymerase sigma factor [Phycisphaerae bacterium]
MWQVAAYGLKAMNDAEHVIDKARQGDRNALSALLREHGPAARAAVRGNIPAKWRSMLSEDDVIQQTYADAIVGIRQFRSDEPGAFSTWLAKLARNNLLAAIGMLETAKRGGDRRRMELGGSDESCVELYLSVTAGGATPSRQVAREEAKSAVLKALDQLPSFYATVVRMYDIEGREVQEVGEQLKRSPGAVYMLRARAHRELARLMGSASDFLTYKG